MNKLEMAFKIKEIIEDSSYDIEHGFFRYNKRFIWGGICHIVYILNSELAEYFIADLMAFRISQIGKDSFIAAKKSFGSYWFTPPNIARIKPNSAKKERLEFINAYIKYLEENE